MNVAIIAAAGLGVRMGGRRPKQFMELAGKPIIFHSVARFEECDAIQEIVVVLPASEAAEFLEAAGKFQLRKLAKVVAGGATRAESVFKGLVTIREATAGIVAVHDAVRPLVSVDEIARTVAAAETEGAAILVSSPVDTVKEVADGTVVKTLDRSRIRNALTPQCFQYRLLRRAYESVDTSDPTLTDESTLVERLGVKIVAVEGSARNIKITRQEDLVIAEELLKNVGG